MNTPCYVFDTDVLLARLNRVRSALPGIPVTYSIKANAFVTGIMGQTADHLEVCSPGELEICRHLGAAGEKIIYSGVWKDHTDVGRALESGVRLLTAESPAHVQLLQQEASLRGLEIQVLLRLSSGNQFGMDAETILDILRRSQDYSALQISGFHFYSGTQKKKLTQISADLEALRGLVRRAETEAGFQAKLVEYGPGLATEYFRPESEEQDDRLLAEAAPLLLSFSQEAPLGLEFGRFLAASCGTYYTSVRDLKSTEGVLYAILDGGIHHLKYYGQMMAINQPPLRQIPPREGKTVPCCLCGSLCTVADVLVREAALVDPRPGDVLAFERCGAYSVTEGSSLFLSRDLPAVYLQQAGIRTMVRPALSTWQLNCPGGLEKGDIP